MQRPGALEGLSGLTIDLQLMKHGKTLNRKEQGRAGDPAEVAEAVRV